MGAVDEWPHAGNLRHADAGVVAQRGCHITMSKYQYRVSGFRFRHKTSEGWHYVRCLPLWLYEFRKREPKKANRYWEVERLYHRLLKKKKRRP